MKIYQDGENKVLREPSVDVPKEMFGTQKLADILQEMQTLLDKEYDGVAIAAPQIGIPYNIFMVSRNVPLLKKEKQFIYINPKIVRVSQEKKFMEEGCLSVRWLYGKVYRHTKATVKARDFDGKLFERNATGLLAHIFQHETDHLSGTLFIDKAVDVYKLDETDIEKLESKNKK